ncbi:MAG: aryl-sulfate sulfotransferase [Planctomycetes bacterium]|nr:aryl-sulfate sulfotransferase [Planctomycetota bacterium]
MLLRSVISFATPLVVLACAAAQDGPPRREERGDRPERRGPERPEGLLKREAGAYEGLTLVSSLSTRETHLIDLDGRSVHSWKSDVPLGNVAYLMADGTLLRAGRQGDNKIFRGGGEGGRIQKLDVDGQVIWDFVWSNDEHLHHHDIKALPNGNVLFLSWEKKTKAEAIAAGRDPRFLKGEWFWPDVVYEVKPVLPSGGEIVWEWHAWDHLIQDRDQEAQNFGVVEEHPERIDINADWTRFEVKEDPKADTETAERLRGLGYVGGPPAGDRGAGAAAPAASGAGAPGGPGAVGGPGRPGMGAMGGGGADWMHSNAVDYHAGFDQILISVKHLNEIWVIDHSTTTAEARGSQGGRYGKGGDLLYRWGNPVAYRGGTPEQRQLFEQHNAHWIPAGRPGAGHILVFNNGSPREGRAWSSADEIALPVDAEGRYAPRREDGLLGPEQALWSYTAPKKQDFFSSFISGVQRLENGNTLICEGETRRVFEVTQEGATVWEWVMPIALIGADAPPGGRGPRGGLFRAERLAPDHPGLAALRAAGHPLSIK